VGVSSRATIKGDDLMVGLTNTAQRTVSIEAVGVSSQKVTGGFVAWNLINHRRTSGGIGIADPALPARLDPGGPAYVVAAPASRVKGTLHPAKATWIWCTDSYGTTRWERVSVDVVAAIGAVQRRVYVPDGAGGFTTVEIGDADDLAGRTLA
jgi:hypothetical protein